MPLSLIKLFITATNTVAATVTTTTTTTIDDNVRRFYATTTQEMIDTVAHTTTIPDTSFFDDNGDSVTAGGLPVPPAGGYFNVYVNGMLQAGGLSTLTNTQLVLNTDEIAVNVPVVLEVHDYSGTTSNSTSVPDISVTTTINT
jgi:hypothetical protein